jgi:hypothetical protein
MRIYVVRPVVLLSDQKRGKNWAGNAARIGEMNVYISVESTSLTLIVFDGTWCDDVASIQLASGMLLWTR